MQFADVKNDIAFRKIFGNETKKEILISFLNAVLTLDDEKRITDVEILNPYQLPRIVGMKATILDVRAKDQTGNSYLVEMQVTDQRGLDKRILYYGAKSYAAQLDANEEYYRLKPVIVIGILDFEYLETAEYLSRHLILDAETHEHKLKDLEFSFIELPKFTKQEHELTTLTEKWIYFIKYARTLTAVPENMDSVPEIHKAFEIANQVNLTREELEDLEQREMFIYDQQGAIIKAVQEGRREEKLAIARQLLDRLDDETISQTTELSIEEVRNLR